MKGKLGSLHVGRLCIGGFIDWQLDVNLAELKGEPSTFKLAKWKLTASSYWLLDVPNKVVVKLYTPTGYWEGKGAVTSQVKHLWDTLIHDSIEVIGEGILEGKN